VGARGGAVRDVDCAVVSGGLEDLLAQVTGREIAGLVGYSYLKRFRVTLDYSRGRAYLEPRPGYREPRPFEFTQVGLQLARGGRGIEVVAVAEGSPAQQAGIAPGARVLQVDSLDAARHDLLTLARALEGPARSTVTITILDGGGTRVVTLRRRRLL
jgi:predicted metalloprotease with PDZ domain